MDRVLGPYEDLLVWIPKKPGAEEKGDWRPLQLPSCFRRLFGASIVHIVGPAIEPLLSKGQSAVKGADCGKNIRKVFDHLQSHGGKASSPNEDLWTRASGLAS